MTDNECFDKLVELCAEMGIKAKDITIGNNQTVPVAVDNVFRHIKNYINKGGEFDEYSPCLIVFVTKDVCDDIRYTVDNVDVIISVSKDFLCLKDFLLKFQK